MSSFLFSFNALTSFTGGNPPTLELLVGGAVVSSIEMISGASSYDVLLDYTGAAPSSFSIRFAGSSGDPGDSINITSASVNNTALNLGTDLTATMLSQSQSTAVSAANALYGHEAPTVGAPDTTGTGGDDPVLHGSNDADSIDALAGNDYVRGRGGDDEITGGDGDDYIFGEAGADTILGGNGNDIIFGNADNDILYGEADNDYLIAGDGDDLLNGGAGNDYLIGEAGADILFGEDGDDYLIGGDGDDLLFGDDGNDVLAGGAGNDSMAGGAGNDQLIGEDGDDLLSGGDGDDEIIAGTGNDIVSGGAGNDSIYGGDGTDELAGGDDDDIIHGGAGDDDLSGDAGNDTIIGGAGADTINGGADDDILHGHGLDAETISTILQDNPNVVYNSATGSFYQFVTANVDYNAARAAANATTLSGLGGHLAVITTENENNFIQTLLSDDAWIAATDDQTNTEWTWEGGIENGIQFSHGATAIGGWYENWDAGQPQNNSEHNTVIYTNGTWHDWPDTAPHSYVIEWEGGLLSDDSAIDTISGGDGADTIYGYGGADILSGGDGADKILGMSGNDTINGDAGNDILYGGLGDDILDGGTGSDVIYGDNASSAVVVEAGSTIVTQANATQWHSVSFSSTIDTPVIKMFGEDVAGDPFTIRVRNVTDNGFEFQLDEFDYQDGSTAAEGISWVAVASGTHTLDNGMQIQAGYTTLTNETSSTVNFSDTSYSSPVVFTQLSSDNELSAVVTRNSSVTNTGFTLQMQEEEANANTHATEDIGWIAIDAGGSAASGILSGTTGDVVTHNTTTINFGGSFANTPIFIADMQTLDGGDTAVTAGAGTISTTGADVFVDEEESADGETAHTSENVGYLALEAGTYSATVLITNGSDIIRGGDDNDFLYADGFKDTSAAPVSSNLLSNAILTDAADGYWALNETAGTTADNQGGGGASLDATINGGATLGAATLYAGGGSSIDFDGVNDGIRVPDSALINTATYTEKTVELVFNADDVTTRQVLYEEGGSTHGLSIYLDGGNIYVTGEHDGQWIDANINAPVSTGTTYHVAFVFDQPSNSFEGFLDGVSMGSVTVNNAVFPSHSGDIGIGYAPDGVQFHDGESGGGFNFNGRISDVAVYTRALSQSELQEHSDIVQGTPLAVQPIDDILYGGDGFDQMWGGVGRDVFVFESASAFNDVDEINGFDFNEQDALDISDLISGYTDGVSDINDFVSISTVGSDSIISVDANGLSGGASFVDIAQINDFTGISADALLINNSLIPV